MRILKIKASASAWAWALFSVLFLVLALASALAALALSRKKHVPNIYFIINTVAFGILSYYFSTPVFFIPCIVGLILGFYLGDRNLKKQQCKK